MHQPHDPMEHVRRMARHHHDDLVAAWSDSETKEEIRQQITAMERPEPDPVAPSPSRRWAPTPVALTAAVALTAVALVVIPSRPPAAFAGWSTEPADISNATRVEIDQWCRAEYSEADDSPVARLMREVGPADLIDMRGGAALAIWSQIEGGTETTATCTVLDTNGDGMFDAGSVGGGVTEHLVGPMSYSGTVSDSDGMRVEAWDGRVADADRVVAVRDDGLEVEASLADSGRFLVWWPGAPAIRELITLDSDGSVLSRWSPEEAAQDSSQDLETAT